MKVRLPNIDELPAFGDAPEPIKDFMRASRSIEDETDRGAALAIAARLDEILLSILKNFFQPTDASSSLCSGFNAPLGTFSARASACMAIGLLLESEYEQINVIRKIRNKFGHEWRPMTFEDASIRDLVMNLDHELPLSFGADLPLRTHFTASAINLLGRLMFRADQVTAYRLQTKCFGVSPK